MVAVEPVTHCLLKTVEFKTANVSLRVVPVPKPPICTFDGSTEGSDAGEPLAVSGALVQLRKHADQEALLDRDTRLRGREIRRLSAAARFGTQGSNDN